MQSHIPSHTPSDIPPFNPAAIESAVHAVWRAQDAYRVTETSNKPLGKFYACSMLPYPSGKLHMGHVRNYTINDMLARQLRMKGYNVLMPMGWDAFGLPAENAAIKNSVPPAKWTYDNIAYMKRQMQSMGLAIDWSRELATCDPSYYKWNQWFFLKMLEKGIVYRETQIINWDPIDQTVLSNEQVTDGRGWRTGALVEKREIPGYYFNITQYAPELLEQIQNGLAGWPERVRLMQENWIGKSEGVRFAFTHDIHDETGTLIDDGRMYVFTTRADTIMGVTFCVVAPEHPIAKRAAQLDAAKALQIEAFKAGGTTEAELATKEKEGVPTGFFVTHPLSGKLIPVWVGNYVLMSYGDGAVMGVPAHDARDFLFAKKYGLPIHQVVGAQGLEGIEERDSWNEAFASKDLVGICGDFLSGLPYAQAVDAVAQRLAEKGLGEKKTTWRLRDWGISRQRYWGTPIPIIYCDGAGDPTRACGAVPVPEKDLPVVLPTDLVPDGSGNPLNKCESFLRVDCPKCGKPARRETDTMDTFVDSSWYFMRYGNPTLTDQMVGAGAKYWMSAHQDPAKRGGMDQYIGGIEHAILHLLYARFWTKVMRDLDLLHVDEPFTRLLCQGMVLNHVYSRKQDKGGTEYFWPHEVENILDADGRITGARLKSDGSAVDYGGITTMSKSKNNGVDPQEIIDRYGADTARLYMMFTAPPEATLEWNDAAVEGSYRFLRRVWHFMQSQANCVHTFFHSAGAPTAPPAAPPIAAPSQAAKTLRRDVHLLLKQANFDYDRMQYNTVVSACMKLLNKLEATELTCDVADQGVWVEGLSILLRLLYPVCPHLCCALWQQLGFEAQMGSLLDAPWPTVDEAALVQDEVELVLQINGKLRGSLRVPASADKATIESVALSSEAFLRQAGGAPAKKIVLVPGRLVNIVV